MSTVSYIRQQESLDERVTGEINALKGRFHVKQSTLGMVIGVSQAQMSQRLNGHKNFSLAEIELLARFFGTTPGYLMGYENAPRPVGPDGGLDGCAIRDSNPEPADSAFGQVRRLWGTFARDLSPAA